MTLQASLCCCGFYCEASHLCEAATSCKLIYSPKAPWQQQVKTEELNGNDPSSPFQFCDCTTKTSKTPTVPKSLLVQALYFHPGNKNKIKGWKLNSRSLLCPYPGSLRPRWASFGTEKLQHTTVCGSHTYTHFTFLCIFLFVNTTNWHDLIKWSESSSLQTITAGNSGFFTSNWIFFKVISSSGAADCGRCDAMTTWPPTSHAARWHFLPHFFNRI